MFELNPQMDITAVTDIGPDNRVGIVIDNIYAEPMKVRELADKLESCLLYSSDGAAATGWRAIGCRRVLN